MRTQAAPSANVIVSELVSSVVQNDFGPQRTRQICADTFRVYPVLQAEFRDVFTLARVVGRKADEQVARDFIPAIAS
jgi:hypothetical protein